MSLVLMEFFKSDYEVHLLVWIVVDFLILKLSGTIL